MWALGHCVRARRATSWRRVCAQMLDRALTLRRVARAPAFAQRMRCLGLAARLREPGDARIARVRCANSRSPIASRLSTASVAPEWEWFEPVMTYDNARLCEAMIRAGNVLGDIRATRDGRVTLAFLERIVFEDGIFVPIGNDGWFPRGGPRARFGQQPLEAAAMVDAELAAFDAFGDPANRAPPAIAAAGTSEKICWPSLWRTAEDAMMASKRTVQTGTWVRNRRSRTLRRSTHKSRIAYSRRIHSG